MKIIIVGCGKVGRTLIDQLSHESHDITVIDHDTSQINEITSTYDVMGVVGNGASYKVLDDAGIRNADLLIAVTESDEINLLSCLFARKAGIKNTIARVRNPQYEEEVNYIKDELGLSLIINPEHAAASEIARILRFPSATKIETFDKGRVELITFTVESGSKINGMNLIDIANLTKAKVLICAVMRGDEVLIPNGRFVIEENDKVSIITTSQDAKGFFKKIGYDTHQVKNAMIAGGGKIAYYLAKELDSSGIDVKILDWDEERCETLSELLPKATIINGDVSNQDVLIEEGIDRTDSFVALTGIDETNVFLTLFAKQRSSAKVITKINRINFNDVVTSFNLGSVISPKEITADTIVSYVRAKQNVIGSNVETLYNIVQGKVEALEFKITANSEVLNKPLMELDIKKNILIGCINRNGKPIIPNGQSQILKGDKVIVVTTETGLNNFSDIFVKQ
ncbi:MAG TPA: Trk system potassium transporter TrkA [Lachnospiraceae bacterium]|nr:Trk system potassium transporter TrkA [Lachnospiraceae bacterium]